MGRGGLTEEPQAGGDLRIKEELAGQCDHALDHIGLDHGATDVALRVLAGTHRTIGEHDAGATTGLEVVEHVLQPGVVGVAGGRRAIHPARIAFEAAVPPVADVEGRVGEYEVGPQVGMLVAGEGVGGFLAQIEVDAAQGKVHGRQAPSGGVGFLAVDAHVAQLAAVGFDELFALHEHAARAAAGVIHLAMVRGEHRDQRLHDAGRRVELPALLALGAGELAEEVFVNFAENIAGHAHVRTKADSRDQIDEFAKLAIGQLGASIAFIQNALELGVFDFDQGQGIVDALADVGLLGVTANPLPASPFRHPEHVFREVVIAVVQLVGEHLGIAVVQEKAVVLILKTAGQLIAAGLESIGDVLQKNQAEHDVLVLGSVHIGPQLVSGSPEGFLQVDVHADRSIVVECWIAAIMPVL